jgi:probable phosphoglycerate mutase
VLTTFLLLRHATCDPVGHRLAGRAPGVSLNEAGRAQAARLAAWLQPTRVDAVYSSPLERTRETAAYVAEPRALAVSVDEAFVELDFGAWTGAEISALDPDERWRRFNAFRSGVRPPAGELMLHAQSRAVAGLLALAEAHPGQTIAVVSHADVLRAVVAWTVGAPLDHFLRLEIAPASATVVELGSWSPRLVTMNAGPDAPVA